MDGVWYVFGALILGACFGALAMALFSASSFDVEDDLACSAPPVSLTGYQLLEALGFVAPDGLDDQLEQSLCIGWRPAGKDLDGVDCPAGVVCWLEDHPEEGCLPLDGAPPRAGDVESLSIAKAIHYPECWDTAAYPTVAHALREVMGVFRCTNEDTHAVQEGWPTNEMIDAGRKAAEVHGPLLGNGQSLWHIFRDMLAAAARAAQQQGNTHA